MAMIPEVIHKGSTMRRMGLSKYAHKYLDWGFKYNYKHLCPKNSRSY